MISKSSSNIFIHKFWWVFAPDFLSKMNTNALHHCNSCLLPYETRVHMERPVPIWKRLLHTGSEVHWPLVPAESKQGNICAKLELDLMDWVQMLAEGTGSKSHQRLVNRL